LLVPYSDPGVVLAREVRGRLAEHAREWGMPRVIYLRIHGLVVLGSSAGQALQLTEMADKVSRVVAATLAMGNVVPMTEESAERIDTRDDEQIRRTALARATWLQPVTDEYYLRDL
jgi:ribulose-5-phosphate 4-epimerase/fuculose-1-phosphate aldolase